MSTQAKHHHLQLFWLLSSALLMVGFTALSKVQAQPCTSTSTVQCTIAFDEVVADVPAHLRTHLNLNSTANPVAVPRVAVVIPDNGQLATPPVVFYAGGHGSFAAASVSINIHLEWPEAVVVYLEANRLVDHDGQWRSAGDGSVGDPDWSPRAPHMESAADHTDVAYLQTVLNSTLSLFHFNLSQVYLVGHSSGGFFALSMRALMPETFRAFAVLGTYADFRSEGDDVPAIVAAGQQAPARPVLYMMGEQENVFEWQPAIPGADDKVYLTVRQLTALNGALVPGQDERAYLIDLVNDVRAVPASGRMLQWVFSPVKTNGAEVVLAVFGGDHSWPPRGADHSSLQASEWAVQFFQQHLAAPPNEPSVLFEKGWTVPVLMAPMLY